jgi:hypothetical protein
MWTVVGALGQGFGHPLQAQAVLAERGGSGGGPLQPPTADPAFRLERGDEHAGGFDTLASTPACRLAAP